MGCTAATPEPCTTWALKNPAQRSKPRAQAEARGVDKEPGAQRLGLGSARVKGLNLKQVQKQIKLFLAQETQKLLGTQGQEDILRRAKA